jgi:hypothetical protein
MDEFTKKVNNLLTRYKEKYPQDCLNGPDNIWIIKPAGIIYINKYIGKLKLKF